MSHATSPSTSLSLSLRTVLLADAATCLSTGTLMTAASHWLASVTGLPEALVFSAGLSLFPIALFMAFIGTRHPIPAAGVWLIILGNAAWVFGSLLLLGIGLTALGLAFVLGQAAAVTVLAALEYSGLKAQERQA